MEVTMLQTGADVATLLIVFQFMILIIITLAMAAGAMYAMIMLNRKIKEIMPMVQGRSRQLAETTDKISNKAAGPFIAAEAKQAKLKAERDHVIASLRREKDGA
ncbi:MAG: hypothetical protein H6647_03720 [Anaerolineales bacterium]|nr:hypothetical protein [Anaerolineales bacterium]